MELNLTIPGWNSFYLDTHVVNLLSKIKIALNRSSKYLEHVKKNQVMTYKRTLNYLSDYVQLHAGNQLSGLRASGCSPPSSILQACNSVRTTVTVVVAHLFVKKRIEFRVYFQFSKTCGGLCKTNILHTGDKIFVAWPRDLLLYISLFLSSRSNEFLTFRCLSFTCTVLCAYHKATDIFSSISWTSILWNFFMETMGCQMENIFHLMFPYWS